MVETEIVPGSGPGQALDTLEAFPDCPAQARRPGQFGQRRALRREDQIAGEFVRLFAAAADQEPALEALLCGPGQRNPVSSTTSTPSASPRASKT